MSRPPPSFWAVTTMPRNSPMRRTPCLALAALLLASVAGCVVAPPPQPQAVAYAPAAPPPARYEPVPPPPGPPEVFYWQPGRWHWDGRGWVWVSGRYVERPRRYAVWEPGHWAPRPGGWVWIEGHWR
jgi:hypothetical protein